MPQKVSEYCRRTGQYVPETPFEIARCVYDSLAMSYQKHLKTLERLTGNTYTTLRVVGGGSNNEALNRATAKACGVRVTAGPAEGTALGNILCQLIALGAVRGEDEARKIVKNSCPLRDFFPA